MQPKPGLVTRRGPQAVKVPVATESAEQGAMVRWFRAAHPKTMIFSVPNGAFLAGSVGRRAAQMARLKVEGLVEGVPDLFIPAWHTFVEMKRTKGGRVSEAQEQVITHLRAAGYTVVVAYGWEDAKVKLQALIAMGEVRA